MKRIFSVCLGLLFVAGLVYAETADRAPAGQATKYDPTYVPSSWNPQPYVHRAPKAWINLGTWDFEGNVLAPWTHTNGQNYPQGWGTNIYNYNGATWVAPNAGAYSLWIDDDDAGSGFAMRDTAKAPVVATLGYSAIKIKWGMAFNDISTNERLEVLHRTFATGAWSAWTVDRMWNADIATCWDSLMFDPFNAESLALAIHYYDGGSWAWYGVFDNITIDGNQSLDHNLAMQSIDQPATYAEPGMPFTPTVTVFNPGLNPETDFLVIYQIDDGAKAVVYQDTVQVTTPDTIQPNTTMQVAGFDDFTPLDLTNYNVTAWVELMGDQLPSDDTLTKYFRTFNELVGNVTDDNNGGAPVDGATITATGPATYSTTTDGDGDYFFFDMTAGTYTVTASKTGYTNEVISGVTVTDNMQTTLDLSMGYPVLALTPSDSIYVSLPWGGSDNSTWQFTLENQGSRDMTYNVSWPALTKGGKAFADSVYGLDVETICGTNLCLGVEFALNHIWVTNAGASSSSGDNYLVEIDPGTGGIVNTFTQPAGSSSGWGWRDMAFDGTYLYASYSGVVDQINPATGAVTGVTITSPQNPARGLAYNPDNDHFYTANFGSSIYEFTRAGTVVNTWANTKAIYGLAYDGANPAGPSLWVWSQDGTPTCQATRFDLTTGTYGTETFQAFGTTATAGGVTFTNDLVPGKSVLLGLYQDTPDRLVGHELRDNNVLWLDITPNTGTVSAYGTENLAVAFDAAGLDSFTDWAANVSFMTNAQLAKANAYVPAYMHVLGLTGVGGGPTQPLSYAFGLNANRPNPVSGKTTFSFTLPRAQDYALKVYNIAGQQVASFAGKGQAGPNSVNWNTGKNGAGVYFYQLASGGMSATRKLVVLR